MDEPSGEEVQPITDEKLQALMEDLESRYTNAGLSSEFVHEGAVYRELLPRLWAAIATKGYELIGPFKMGASSSVWYVKESRTRVERALKVARPSEAHGHTSAELVRAERDKLLKLRHPNLQEVFDSGEIEDLVVSTEHVSGTYTFPYFVTELFTDFKNLSQHLRRRVGQRDITGEQIVEYVHDILSGLRFLHEENIVHCDIKPNNLFIPEDTQPTQSKRHRAVVADLGYAKLRLRRSAKGGLTGIPSTRRYSHPTLKKLLGKDEDEGIVQIDRTDLKVAFDLYAFGKVLQETLSSIYKAEEKLRSQSGEYKSLFSPYEWQYLALISKRLLDGKWSHHDNDPFLDDHVPGVTPTDAEDLKYLSAEEAIEDVERLLGRYDLEGVVPELNPNTSMYLQISGIEVPMTTRVRDIINHPTLARLGQITQLGFVSLIYPGATHTRYEHTLGVFANCCRYVQSLWYDDTDCLFRSIMREKDLVRVLVAALIHDVGQSPMAHDLEEISELFRHEDRTSPLLTDVCHDPQQRSLAQIIWVEWGLKLWEVQAVLFKSKKSTFRDRILHSILSGPIDCDKLDYLMRDSRHLGVHFGDSLSAGRIHRHLTVVYDDKRWKESEQEDLRSPEIGVHEKALAAARGLWKVRAEMFQQVYWHHSVRSLKAMLGYSVRDILIRGFEDKSGKSLHETMDTFRRFTFDPRIAFDRLYQRAQEDPDDEVIAELQSRPSELNLTDDALITLLILMTDGGAQAVLRMIRRRDLYRRVGVVSSSQNEATIKLAREAILHYRGDDKYEEIEALRVRWENQFLTFLTDQLQKKKAEVGRETLEGLKEKAKGEFPLVLADIPVRAFWSSEEMKGLPIVREKTASPDSDVIWRRRPDDAAIAETRVLDFSIGKVRFFAHPELYTLSRGIVDIEEFGRKWVK